MKSKVNSRNTIAVFSLGGLFVALVLGSAPCSQAEPLPVLTYAGTGTEQGTATGIMVGFEFTVNEPLGLSVTTLGVWDGPNDDDGSIGDGLEKAAKVGVWLDGDTTALASATVPSDKDADLRGEYRYVSITPITLTHGNTYVLGSLITIGDDVYRRDDNSTATWDSHVTGLATRYKNSSTFQYPTERYVDWPVCSGPNAEFNVVPEPSSLVLLGAGALLTLLVACARRRRRP